MNALACIATIVGVAAAAMAARPRRQRLELEALSMTNRTRLDDAAAAWKLRRALARTPSARNVAEWCDELARRVRSGSSLRDVLATVLPADAATAAATMPLRLGIDRGASIPEAVGRVANGGPDLDTALSVISTASRIGGPCAAAIDRTAMSLRQRATDGDERATQAAQARLSSHVMTAVPLLMLGVLLTTDDDVRSVVTSPIGALCITIGLALNVLGSWWMHCIVRGTS